MAKAPDFSTVAGSLAPTIIDIAAARIGLLADADVKQTALAHGWGGPGIWAGCRLEASDSFEVKLGIPPGVTEYNLRLLVSGAGEITITTGNDATGTVLEWTVDTPDDVANAITIATTGVIDPADGAATGRAVTVRAALGWSWDDEIFSFVMSAGLVGTVHGVQFSPVYVPK